MDEVHPVCSGFGMRRLPGFWVRLRPPEGFLCPRQCRHLGVIMRRDRRDEANALTHALGWGVVLGVDQSSERAEL